MAKIKLHTHLCFSLRWYCGYCGKDVPALTATSDKWLHCVHCGTKYDLADTYIAPNQRMLCVELDSAGVPYVGADIK